MRIEDLRGRATITIPEAGQALGLGRAAAYSAALRGEIPTLTFGRRKLVPVGQLLQMLGFPQTQNPPAPTEGLADLSASNLSKGESRANRTTAL